MTEVDLKVSMYAVDPEDIDDAIEALSLVEDLNGLIETKQIKVQLNDGGAPALYPV